MNRSVWIIIVIAAVALFYFTRGFHVGGSDTIEYRGESFNMSKVYSSYDDYKEDPNNLATNELPRIEKAITNAPFPLFFDNNGNLALAVLDLKFPGYGCGGHGAYPQSDGSTCSVFSVDIPMLNKERFFIGRTSGGRVAVVDDFVLNTATNEIENVKIEGTHILYYDGNGILLRDKHM
jgi:hypothetical protein